MSCSVRDVHAHSLGRFADRQLYAADGVWLLLTLRMIVVLIRDYLKFQTRVPCSE